MPENTFDCCWQKDFRHNCFSLTHHGNNNGYRKICVLHNGCSFFIIMGILRESRALLCKWRINGSFDWLLILLGKMIPCILFYGLLEEQSMGQMDDCARKKDAKMHRMIRENRRRRAFVKKWRVKILGM